MDDDGEFSDGEIVWVKLSNCWWPGEVMGDDRLTEDFLSSLKKRPLAVVKFFDEDSYEYVKNPNYIFKYNCARKNEFLRKGLEQFRGKNKHMNKFPADVMFAEKLTGGDPNIVNMTDFSPLKRERYTELFQDATRSPTAKGKGAKGKSNATSSPAKAVAVPSAVTSARRTVHEVRFRTQTTPQPSSSSTAISNPMDAVVAVSSAPATPEALPYKCHKCNFSSNRQNVIILHTKHCRAVSVAHPSPKPLMPATVVGKKPAAKMAAVAAPPPPTPPPPAPAVATEGRSNVKVVMVEVLEVLEDIPVQTSTMSRRTVKSAAATPKVDRRKKLRSLIQYDMSVDEVVLDKDEMLEKVIDNEEEEGANEPQQRQEEKTDGGVDVVTVSKEAPPSEKAGKGKTDVELKNELLADWSEDELELGEDREQEGVDKSPERPKARQGSVEEKLEYKTTIEQADDKTAEEPIRDAESPLDDVAAPDKANQDDATKPSDDAVGSTTKEESSGKTSVDSSPAIASPASIMSGSTTTIKYRNIPKKQKREYIEVTSDDVPAHGSSDANDKWPSEGSVSSISTVSSTESSAGTGTSDKAAPDSAIERPISAKQLILNRATRGSSKSLSSDEMKSSVDSTLAAVSPVSAEKAPSPEESNAAGEELPGQTESQTDESRIETSCFDFKEDEEEDVVLSKSPRRSLSNRKDTPESGDPSAEVDEPEVDHEQAEKDAMLANEIESLLCNTAVPTLPSLPTAAASQVDAPETGSASESSTESALPSKEEIDCNRTLPPKERGKRIFKTRNKIIENETIAMEQSKAIVLDFVKKSHEQELVEMQQQQTVAVAGSESSSTEKDDSQDSIRNEADDVQAAVEPVKFENSEYAAIKAKRTKYATEEVIVAENPELPPVAAVVEDPVPESIVSATASKKAADVVSPSTKGRRGKQKKPTPTKDNSALVEKIEEKPQEATVPKVRKKRSTELQSLDYDHINYLKEARNASKAHEGFVVEETGDKQRKSRRNRKEPVNYDERERLDVDEMVKLPLAEPKLAIAPTIEDAKNVATAGTQPSDCDVVKPEPVTTSKHQPIKMIIKSKGKTLTSSEIVGGSVTSPDREVHGEKPSSDDTGIKSPKTLKRKKDRGGSMERPLSPTVAVPPLDNGKPANDTRGAKVRKSKKVLPAEPLDKLETNECSTATTTTTTMQPSATDLQIAEALIHLPESAPPKVVQQLTPEVLTVVLPAAPNNDAALALPAAPNNDAALAQPAKSINPRKRHLQTMLLSGRDAGKEQPSGGRTETVSRSAISPTVSSETSIIPEKKKRDVRDVAPVECIAIDAAKHAEPLIDEKFDIDSMPIVIGDGDVLEGEPAISTAVEQPMEVTSPEEPLAVTVQELAKPKKIVIVKSSNGSPLIPMDEGSLKKKLCITNSPITVTGKLGHDQRPATFTMRPQPHMVQASNCEQLVITSKGDVLCTESLPATSHKSKSISSVSTKLVTSTIASGSRMSSGILPAISTPVHLPGSLSVKSKVVVKSQEIIYPKQVIPSIEQELPKPVTKSLIIAPTPSSKKVIGKKLLDTPTAAPSANDDEPRAASSTGTSTTAGARKGQRVIRITPQKLKEFSRLGLVEEKGQGKVLTASGLRKFKQEQMFLQQQKPHKEVSSTTSLAEVKRKQKPAVAHTAVPEGIPSASEPTPVVALSPPTATVMPHNHNTVQQQQQQPKSVVAAADSSVNELAVADADILESSVPEEEEEEEESHHAKSKDVAAPSSKRSIKDATNVECIPEKLPDRVEPASSPTPAPCEVSSDVVTADSGSNMQESQFIAVSAENFGGPANLFYLCAVREEGLVPVNNELLYLDASNQLVALPENATPEDIINQAEVLLPANAVNAEQCATTGAVVATAADAAEVIGGDGSQQSFLLNTQDGQQIIFDQQSLMALAASGDTSQLLTQDGQQLLLQGSAQELLAALAVSQPGLGIVAADGAQIIVAPETLIDLQEPLPGEIIQVNPNTTVETNAVLTKPPIMSTAEVPTKNGSETASSSGLLHGGEQKTSDTVATTNLDESLAAVIGLPGNPNVPTSLELPITVTNPVIAKTSTSKINPLFPITTTISPSGAIESAAVAAVIAVELPAVAQTGTDSDHLAGNDSRCSKEEDKEDEEEDEEQQQQEEEENEQTMVPLSAKSDSDDVGTMDSMIEQGRRPQLAESADDDRPVSRRSSHDDEDIENRSQTDSLDEIIPNTPESQMNSEQQISAHYGDEYDDQDAIAAGDEEEMGEEEDDEEEEDEEEDAEEQNEDEEEDEDDDEDDNGNGSDCSEIIPIQPNVVVLHSINNELVNNNENSSSDMELEDPDDTAMVTGENDLRSMVTVPQANSTGMTVFDANSGSAVVER